MTNIKSNSNIIHLSIKDKTVPHYHFVLESANDTGSPKDIIKVRWVNPNKNMRLFDGMNSHLRFIINKERIFTLKPKRLPVIIGYDINNNTHEEEAAYDISRSLLKELAYAKSVEVELNSKHRIYVGTFNKWHTFRAFKDFVKNT